jgi:hypothetical protein
MTAKVEAAERGGFERRKEAGTGSSDRAAGVLASGLWRPSSSARDRKINQAAGSNRDLPRCLMQRDRERAVPSFVFWHAVFLVGSAVGATAGSSLQWLCCCGRPTRRNGFFRLDCGTPAVEPLVLGA